jgi:predicted DNA-binding WGR domain protein
MFNYRTSEEKAHHDQADPHRPLQKHASLQLTATLFGEWAFVAEWGRIGSAGRVQERVFPALELAEAALARRQRAKMRRGYRPTAQ